MMTNRARAEYKSLTQQQSNSLDASGWEPRQEPLQAENYEGWSIGSREQSFINSKDGPPETRQRTPHATRLPAGNVRGILPRRTVFRVHSSAFFTREGNGNNRVQYEIG